MKKVAMCQGSDTGLPRSDPKWPITGEVALSRKVISTATETGARVHSRHSNKYDLARPTGIQHFHKFLHPPHLALHFVTITFPLHPTALSPGPGSHEFPLLVS